MMNDYRWTSEEYSRYKPVTIEFLDRNGVLRTVVGGFSCDTHTGILTGVVYDDMYEPDDPRRGGRESFTCDLSQVVAIEPFTGTAAELRKLTKDTYNDLEGLLSDSPGDELGYQVKIVQLQDTRNNVYGLHEDFSSEDELARFQNAQNT